MVVEKILLQLHKTWVLLFSISISSFKINKKIWTRTWTNRAESSWIFQIAKCILTLYMYCFSLHLLLFELTILCNYQCWPHFFFKIIFILWPETSCAGTQIIEIKIISHPILKLILIPFSFMNYSQLKYAMDGFCSESWTLTLLSVLVHNLMALCIDASFSFFMPSIFNYWRFDVDVFLSFVYL